MIFVRKDLCIGCGECVQSCPNDAISLFWGQAKIDHDKCDSCLICREVCPQGAIVEGAPILKEELVTTVTGLRERTDNLLERIERLRR